MNKIEMRQSLLFCLLIWLTSSSAQASMWSDPDWEQMLKESELIALVEVIDGGKFVAKVKTLTPFKGSPEPEFYVTGFNNHNWPEEAIKIESFGEKARYYLFARRREESVHYLEFLAGADRGFIQTLADFLAPILGRPSSNSEVDAGLKAAKTGHLWSVWTPSAGDLPVEGEKVHCSLLNPSYPRQAMARDRAEFERFLKAAVAYHLNTQTDQPLLEEALEAVRKDVGKPLNPRDSSNASEPEQPSDLSHSLATYFLLGGVAWDDAFETIATGQDVDARFILARLLGRITEGRARKLLLAMLKDSSSVVQGEVVRHLAKGNSEQVGSVLLAALSKAGEGGIYPQNLMDPVRNHLDGGRIEIIRALGELKYKPAAPALIHLLEVTENEYSLQILLEALDKMENREYARALEKSLTKEPLIYKIAEWTRDHRLTDLKGAFEQLLEHPPSGVRRLLDLSAVSRALGAIGDDKTGAKLAEQLDRLSSEKVAEVHAQGVAEDMIGALAALRYQPGRSAVARSFFYWFGIDSVFATNAELLKTKQELQRDVESEARKCLSEFRQVDAEALVFLQNRAALVNSSEIKPNYGFALEVGIRSQEHPETKADSLQARLRKAFDTREGSIGVTRWIRESYGESSGSNDARLGGRNDSLFLWRWAQYVQATRDPEDLRLAKFLLESGLAERWDAADSIKGVFESVPIE